jgi:hypothetical protein
VPNISGAANLATVIALANAALPNDDPHKITRAMIDEIRHASDEVPYAGIELDRIADALASYLPPETP